MTATTEQIVGHDYLLTVYDVAKLFKVDRRTIWRWLQQGKLPPPVRYSRTVVRWRASEMQAYLRANPGDSARR
jgi:excisionase family DNA binding protein